MRVNLTITIFGFLLPSLVFSAAAASFGPSRREVTRSQISRLRPQSGPSRSSLVALWMAIAVGLFGVAVAKEAKKLSMGSMQSR